MDPYQQSTTTPQPVISTPAPNSDPGKTLGIVSFAINFVGLGLIAIILGIIAFKKSKQAGHKNGFAVAGIIIGVFEVIAGIILSIFLVSLVITFFDVCNEYGSGTHVLTDGTSFTCSLE